MVAKRFFYVCAGILCFALAYHLGARSATAQAGKMAEMGEFEITTFPPALVVLSAGRLTAVDPSGRFQSPPVPGGAQVVAIYFNNNPGAPPGTFYVALANGDYYRTAAGESGWSLVGNIFDGATTATQETWGGVKARYRPGAPQDARGQR